jgi:protocatechuate 4,5-dioxygenase, alpha chain
MHSPPLTLEEPGTILFTAERALEGHCLNRFALSLRDDQNRQSFLADEDSYMRRFNVADGVRQSVAERDWTALLKAGGHLQAILKLAATVGMSLWDVGAHNAGCSAEDLRNASPRYVSGLPQGRF